MKIRNKIFITLSVLLLMPKISCAFQASTPNKNNACSLLSSLQWQNRILLIPLNGKSPEPDLLSHLRANKAAIDERRLKVIFITNDKLIDKQGRTYTIGDAESCRHIAPQDANKRPFLVGLDGGLKSVYEAYDSSTEIDLKAVFADIDGMPMRRAELKNIKTK